MTARGPIHAMLPLCDSPQEADERAAELDQRIDALIAATRYEDAAAIEAKQAEYEIAERDQFGNLDHETVLQGEAVRDMAALLRRIADGETR